MITSLHVKGFKSWRDTGELHFAPLTGFFGTNSSGKTSLLQLLLLLKQTAESPDRTQVLDLGRSRVSVDVGVWKDILQGHKEAGAIEVAVGWARGTPLGVKDPDSGREILSGSELSFEAKLTSINGGRAEVERMGYHLAGHRFGMEKEPRGGYLLTAEGSGFEFRKAVGRPRITLPPPVKCYGFPDEVRASYRNAEFVADLALAFETLCKGIFYLGPLRAYPERQYPWAGSQPADVGTTGEKAVEALIAARPLGRKKGWGNRTLEGHVAHWLQKLGLVSSFRVEELVPGSGLYRVVLRSSKSEADVLITDVGFGVSQLLPVLVLCFYAPEGSTVILEQPEIHLHPSVQTGLADVLLDAVERRRVQIIVESHSEHLLRRLQRRIAEEKVDATKAALFFCSSEHGASLATRLDVDLYGNVRNWPEGFFGDEIEEIAAATMAAQRRRQREGAS